MKTYLRSLAAVFAMMVAATCLAVALGQPKPAPARWLGLIGEYGPDDDILIILETDGRLCASFKSAEP